MRTFLNGTLPGMVAQPRRCALYARISLDELGLEKGVERQLEDARALAESRGWRVVGEFVDNDVSAYKLARRERYEELKQVIERGELDAVVVWHTSRIWRNRRERAEGIELFARHRVSLVPVKGPELDMSTAYGRGMAGLLGEFDTMESDVKAERLQRAALQRAREGKSNGPVAYGWRRERVLDDRGRVVAWRDVEDPAEAAIVREIVDRLLVGESVKSIRDDMNRRGVPAPRGERWLCRTVTRLATRPANVGLRVWKAGTPEEEVIPAEWPPIVDRARHERVVALLADPARKMSRPGKRRNLLTYGIGECGVCGGQLRRKTNRGLATYTCNEGECVARAKEPLDEFVGLTIAEWMSRPGARAVFAPEDDGELEKLEGERDALRARLDSAADAFASGAIDAGQLRRITARLRPELERVEAELRQVRASSVVPEVHDLLAAADPYEVWRALPVSRQRAVLEAAGVRVRILPIGRGNARRFDPRSVEITRHRR